MRVVATLAARGFQVRPIPEAGSQLVRVSSLPASVVSLPGRPDGEVVVEDDGYAGWRYWSRAGRAPGPVKVADLIADVLSRDVTSGAEVRS